MSSKSSAFIFDKKLEIMIQKYWKFLTASAGIAVFCSLTTVGLYAHLNQASTTLPTNYAEMRHYPATGVDFVPAAAAVTPGVVHIKTTSTPKMNMGGFHNPIFDLFGDQFFGANPYQMGPQESSGSGVIISEDGYIVTNNHVVDNADKIEIVFSDKHSAIASVVGTDPSTDLALLKVEEKNLPYVYFGNSDSVKVGEWVLAVGNPFNLESTVTAGIVSAKGRNINIIKDRNNAAIESFIQTDAAVNPGNSGGALVNLNGELIGINSAIATPTGTYAGYSFAIPVNIVKKVIDDLTKYGVVQRAILGVAPQEMNDDLARQAGLSSPQGIYVANVNEGTAAAEAGLQKGDVIVRLDGSIVKSTPELLERVGGKRPGDNLDIEYYRNGKLNKVQAKLRNRDGNDKLMSKEEIAAVSFDQLGAVFENASPDVKRKMQINSGVVIKQIQAGSKLASVGVPEGFIITKLNKKEVNSVAEVKDIIKNNKGMIMMEGVMPGYNGKYYYTFN